MTDPPTFDADLAYRVLDAIEANPERWDQREWRAATDCGTVMCFAGWTAHICDDVRWVVPDEMVEDDWMDAHEVQDQDGYYHDIGNWAYGRLGLGCGNPLNLFSPHHTLADLRAIVDHYAAHGTSREAAQHYRRPQ